VDVAAPITAVTVYPDRARVLCRGTVHLDEGTQELRVPDLTTLLDPDSVRVAGRGTARVRLTGVDVRREYYAETPSVPAAELRRRLEEAQDVDQAHQDEINLLDAQLQVLMSTCQHAGESLARGIGRGRAKVADGEAVLNLVEKQHTRLSARKREVMVLRRRLAAEIVVVQRELDRLQGAQPRERYMAMVGIEALSAGEFELDLEYTTQGGAGWRPLYDLRIPDESQDPGAELTYMAQVQQSTGEEWLGVDMTLSTARPAVSAQLPELSPWYVRLYQPPQPKAGRQWVAEAPAPPPMADLMAAPGTSGAEPEEALRMEPVVAEVMEAQVDSGGAAISFHIPRRVDIPADNTPRKVTVLTLELKPQLDYVTAPKLIGEVYRRAKVVNDSEVLLLPGAVSLFHGGQFAGSAELQKVAPQETFETTLGIEDRIRVERKLALKEVGKQFIGDRRVLRYAYEIEIENLLPHEAAIEVLDQRPVAGHEDIKVKLESAEPTPTRQSEQGELAWEAKLAQHGKQTLRFEFSLSAPRSAEVTGLPED
jgi:uncharacterized protein (TIGR02231 family)